MCVAPIRFAASSFLGSMSTAMIGVAPASAEPAIAATPTPPQPITATDLPRETEPVLIAAPKPAITPQPSRPTAAARADGSTLVHCPAATRVFSANAPIPSAGDSSVPSSSVIFWVALWVAKQYQGSPRSQARQLPHTARQLRTTKSPGRHRGHVRADRLDDTGRLVAEQEREVVVDAALAVVQVGVADPAGLHLDQRLAGPRVGDVDRGHLDRLTLAPGHDCLHLMHGASQPHRTADCNLRPPSRVIRDVQTIQETGAAMTDRDADFTAYLEARQPRLLRIAYLLTGDPHQAEDLLQTSLAKLYLSWDKVREREHVDAYVRRIMVNENNSLWRRAWRRREVSTDEVPELTPVHDRYDEGKPPRSGRSCRPSRARPEPWSSSATTSSCQRRRPPRSSASRSAP